MTSATTLAERLRQARKRRGLSQSELAALADMPPSSIGNIEQGLSKSSRKVMLLAAILGVRPEWLADGIPPMEPAPEVNARQAPMTAEQYISLLRRVRAVVPRSALRYDSTLARDIDAAIADPVDAAKPNKPSSEQPYGMGTVDVQYEALHWGDGIVLARLGDEG